MTSAIFQKRLGALRPVDDIAQAMMRDIKDGEHVKLAVPKRPRNPNRHRLYWALMALVVDNTNGKWPNAEALHFAMKLHMGLIEEIASVNGEIILRPKSTSFSAMSEAEFSAFMNRVVDVICAEIMPGLDPQTLRMEAHAA